MFLGNEWFVGIYVFIEIECYICCFGLREEGEVFLCFVELFFVLLKEES